MDTNMDTTLNCRRTNRKSTANKLIVDLQQVHKLKLQITLHFFARKQLMLLACLSHRNSVCPSVCLSHGWISQKRSKLGLPNLHRRMEDFSFRNRKAFP